MEHWRNDTEGGKHRYSEKSVPSATLSTTELRWTDVEEKPCLRGGRLDTKPPELWYGSFCSFVCFWRFSPQWAEAFSCMRFLDHTQRRIEVGRTTLEE